MELQLFLVWHNSISQISPIIQMLSVSFKIRGVFETDWSELATLKNMKKIYQFSEAEAKQKISECGYGTVYIVIVEDMNPTAKMYPTKYGIIPVSKNAQETKTQIRNYLGKDKAIHGTMIDFEFEADLQTCLHYTKETFQKKYTKEWNGKICKL